MIKNSDNTRFGRRLESLFWWILRLFPLAFYLVFMFAIVRNESVFVAFGDELPVLLFDTFDFEFALQMIGVDSTSYLYAVFFDILNTDFGLIPLLHNTSGLFLYMLYLFSLELLRVFLNILLFIPRWINTIFDKMFK